MKALHIFDTIDALVPTLDGWATIEKANTLAALVLAARPFTVVELGTYAGRSAIPMALAMKHLGQGILIGVDPYSPDESAKNETVESALWWKNLNHNAILEKFKTQINTLGLQNVIRLERMTSDAFDPPDSIDILHVDGSHGIQVKTDVMRYCPRVRVGGYVIMDDINWCVNGVQTVKEATNWMLENGFRKLYEVIKPAATKDQPGDDWAVFFNQK